MTYAVPVTVTDAAGVARTDYCTGNTRRTAEAAAAFVARMERLEGNAVTVGRTRKEA